MKVLLEIVIIVIISSVLAYAIYMNMYGFSKEYKERSEKIMDKDSEGWCWLLDAKNQLIHKIILFQKSEYEYAEKYMYAALLDWSRAMRQNTMNELDRLEEEINSRMIKWVLLGLSVPFFGVLLISYL